VALLLLLRGKSTIVAIKVSALKYHIHKDLIISLLVENNKIVNGPLVCSQVLFDAIVSLCSQGKSRLPLIFGWLWFVFSSLLLRAGRGHALVLWKSEYPSDFPARCVRVFVVAVEMVGNTNNVRHPDTNKMRHSDTNKMLAPARCENGANTSPSSYFDLSTFSNHSLFHHLCFLSFFSHSLFEGF